MCAGFLKCTFVLVCIGFAWCEICKPEFKSNLVDSLVVTYDMRRLDVSKMSLRLVDNLPFVEIFSDSCSQKVKTLRLEYRAVGEEVWNEYSGRRGSIDTDRTAIHINNIDPCLEYEVQFVAIAEDDTEYEAPHLDFGPFYKELSQEDQEMLTYESMPDISNSITYSNVSSSGFTVSWGQICAQSANVFLLKGPNFKFEEPYQVLTNLLEKDDDNSLWVATNSCEEFKVVIETFMTKEPIPDDKELDASRDHNAQSTIITDPEFGHLASGSMEEGSAMLTLVFAQQMSCLSHFSYEILLTGETNVHVHQLEIIDWEETSGSMDLSKDSYLECSNYQLEMKVQYETKASHYFEETVFSRELRTNQVGRFDHEGTNEFHVIDDVIHVTFDSCNKEALLCLTENEALVMNVTVNADTPNVPVQTFEAVVENCVEYKISLDSVESHDHVYGVGKFPRKPPTEKVDIHLTDFTTSSLAFEVLGAEENKKCKVEKYTVTCQNKDKDKNDTKINGSEFHDDIHFISGIEGSGTLENNTQNLDEEQANVEFTAISKNSSKINIENLMAKTWYECAASIHYLAEENNEVISSSTIHVETEGFDGLEINEDGKIMVTCNSRLENLSLALVSQSGYIVKTVDANCLENDHIDMFKNETEECLEYTIELYESKALEKFVNSHNYKDPSLLTAIDIVIHPEVKEPNVVPELHFLSSHNRSLTFNVTMDLPHHWHCQIKFYCVTCSNGIKELDKGVHHAVDPQVTVDGLERDDTYNCSTHVEVEGEADSGNQTKLWTRYSKPIEVETEGFDEMEMLENGDVQVTCGSNVGELNLVLVEGDVRKIGVIEASCNGSTVIDDFIKSMKPCGEYKIQLIARQEYDNLMENGTWEDGDITAVDKILLDVKEPEGQPKLILAASHPNSVELKIEDKINIFCKVESIEIDCEGKVNDTFVKILKAPSENELKISSALIISGLSPEHSYACSAIVKYSPVLSNHTFPLQITNETAAYNPTSDSLTVQTTKGIHLKGVLATKSSSNTIWYIVIAVGVIFGIIVGIICRRRRSGSKDLVETTNLNVVNQKDNGKVVTDVDVEVAN